MQLRFIPDLEEITKVIIVTDEVDAISPGVLCRDFMASHDRIPWDVPIVLGLSDCGKADSLSVVCDNVNGCFKATKNNTLRDVNAQLFVTCNRWHEESEHTDYSTPHNFIGVRATLRDLCPYPSLYTRMTANKALTIPISHYKIEYDKLPSFIGGQNNGPFGSVLLSSSSSGAVSDVQSVTVKIRY